MSAADEAQAVRSGAGLFRLPERGLLRVEGGDRLRWLDGMVSNDIRALEPGPERSGCYAALLTRQGRIVADLHVLLREACFWLETSADGATKARETFERFIIADDVTLLDASGEVERLGLEGPAAPAVLEAALGAALPLADDACLDIELAGVPLVVASFGWSGAPARQLLVPSGAGGRVAAELLAQGEPHGLLEAGPAALDILRVEAGVPRLGAELDEDVLPAEARLERAVSTTKACYTGQEVVARMHSRGRVGHLLVGFEVEGDVAPEPGDVVSAEGRSVGEVTSACISPVHGPIALGYVRSARAEPGTPVRVGDREGRVAELPFGAARGS